MAKVNTAPQIVSCMEQHLGECLNIETTHKYKMDVHTTTLSPVTLNNAIHHQNIIGWENLLRGYASTYWVKTQIKYSLNASSNRRRAPWNTTLISSVIELHKNIWEERNLIVHGETVQESLHKLHQRTIEQVKELYKENPILAPRFPAIKAIPLDQRLRRTTKNLQVWIARIEHQKMITLYIFAARSADQMTIREAFRRIKVRQGIIDKYPP
jgi:hypothetical protein